MSDHVTIPKYYLDTLLRRANLHQQDESVRISRIDYDSLVEQTYQFRSLKTALVAGGTSEETLQILIDSQSYINHPDDSSNQNHDSFKSSRWYEAHIESQVHQEGNKERAQQVNGAITYADRKQLFSPSTPVSTIPSNDEHEQSAAGRLNSVENTGHNKRSLVLKDIPDKATLRDVLNVVRGGLIANIYVYRHQNTAHVTFFEPEAAEAFLNYSRQNKVFVLNKPIEVLWNDHQEYIHDHIYSCVRSGGATRNLVLRFLKPGMTAKSIKEDLDHIHRLEVVEIKLEAGHAWVSLNSIRHATTAKNCMKSRFKYQGTRIEFYPDVCDQPLQLSSTTEQQTPKVDVMMTPAALPFGNRFGVLSSNFSKDTTDDMDEDDNLILS